MSRWSTPGEAYAYETGYIEGMADAKRWIPVTERLPKEGQIVLVVGKTKEINLARYTHPFFDFGENITSRVGKVTHWMPLPEPWKGGEK